MQDPYRDWDTALLTFVGTRYSDSILSGVLSYGCRAWIEPSCDRYRGQDTQRKAKMFVAGLRGHLQALTLEEDEDKVTVVLGILAEVVAVSCRKAPMLLLAIS